jgi:hypothetical protein
MSTSFTGFGTTTGFTGAGAGSGGSNTQFPTYAAAKAASIPAATNFVTTMGYYNPGDGGASTYQRVTALPLYDPGFTSTHDGSLWSLVPKKPLHVRQFGFVGDGTTDDSAAVFNMTAYMPYVASESRYFPGVTISGTTITPIPGTPATPHELHCDQLVRFFTTGSLPSSIVPGKLYFTRYGSVTSTTLEISSTTGLLAGQMTGGTFSPGSNYVNNAAKGAAIDTTGQSQSGIHTMVVYGENWEDITIDPGVYRVKQGVYIPLGINNGLQKVRLFGSGTTMLSDWDASIGLWYSLFNMYFNWTWDYNNLSPGGSFYAPQAQFATPTSLYTTLPVYTITLLNAAEATKFRINSWCRLEGLDVQGDESYSNPYYFEFKRITAIDTNAGTVTFSQPLKYYYRSTYPSYLNNQPGTFPGVYFGPATISQMADQWDTQIEIHDTTIWCKFDLELNCGAVRSIRFVNCTFRNPPASGQGGPFPFVIESWIMEKCTMINGWMEIDKAVDTMICRDCYFDGSYLTIQSPGGPNKLIIDNCSMKSGLGGTAKDVIIKNSTILYRLSVGPSFGNTEKLYIENSFIEQVVLSLEAQQIVLLSSVTISGGTLVLPTGGRTASGSTYNGPGTVTGVPIPWARPRNSIFVVSNTALSDPGSTVYGSYTANSIGSPFTVLDVYTGAPGTLTGTNFCVDTTLTGLPTSTFTFTASVSGTSMTVTATNPSGAVFFGNGSHTITGNGLPAGTTISAGPSWVTGSSNGVYTLSKDGGTIGSNTFTATLTGMHFLSNPCPRMTVINSGGCQLISGMSGGPPEIPLFSYFSRLLNGFDNGGTFYPTAQILLMGVIKSWSINVVKAYSGAAGTMDLSVSMLNFVNTANNLVPKCPIQVINLKTLGERIITPAGVTGALTGDTLVAVTGWLTGGHHVGWSAADGSDTVDKMAEVVMTAQTDQGTYSATMSVGTTVFGFDVIAGGDTGATIL